MVKTTVAWLAPNRFPKALVQGPGSSLESATRNMAVQLLICLLRDPNIYTRRYAIEVRGNKRLEVLTMEEVAKHNTKAGASCLSTFALVPVYMSYTDASCCTCIHMILLLCFLV